MSPIIANIPSDAHASPHNEPERELLCAVLKQAAKDLRDADAFVQSSAIRFWRGAGGGDLAWLCAALGLDMAQVQRAVARRYPEVWAPRQLELALEEAS
jgi:hypothetical protein